MEVQWLPATRTANEALLIPDEKLDFDTQEVKTLTQAMKRDQRAAHIIAGAAMVNVKPNVLCPANDEALDSMDRKHFRDLMNRFTDKQYMSFINSENGDDPKKVANDITMIWRAFKGASESSEIYAISPATTASELDIVSQILDDLPVPFPYTDHRFGKPELARLLRRHDLSYADFAVATGKSLMLNMQMRDGATASIKKMNDMQNALYTAIETLRQTLYNIWNSVQSELREIENEKYYESVYYIDYVEKISDFGLNLEALRERRRPKNQETAANTEPMEDSRSPSPPSTETSVVEPEADRPAQPLVPKPRHVPDEIYSDLAY